MIGVCVASLRSLHMTEQQRKLMIAGPILVCCGLWGSKNKFLLHKFKFLASFVFTPIIRKFSKLFYAPSYTPLFPVKVVTCSIHYHTVSNYVIYA